METFFKYSRYMIIVPVIGLTLAASAYFLIGGFSLMRLIAESVLIYLGVLAAPIVDAHVPLAISMVEFVHQLLIGTVLYITALGFYQLFIKELDVPGWQKVTNTEQLETALVGVTVVVIGVHFMTTIFAGGDINLLYEGLASGVVIASLGVFLGLRAWAQKQQAQAILLEHQVAAQTGQTISHS